MRATQQPILCFLHGWGFAGNLLAEFAGEFSRDWQIRILKMPGYDGESPLVRGLDGTARELIKAMPRGDDAILIGWSLGGLIGVRMATLWPVRKLVLIASQPCFVARPDWPWGMSPALLADLKLRLRKNPARTLREFALLSGKGDSGERSTYERLAEVLARSAVHPRALADGLEILMQADLRNEFSSLSCRVGALLGRNDHLIPAHSVTGMLALRPDLECRILDDCGHAPFLSRRTEARRQIEELLSPETT